MGCNICPRLLVDGDPCKNLSLFHYVQLDIKCYVWSEFCSSHLMPEGISSFRRIKDCKHTYRAQTKQPYNPKSSDAQSILDTDVKISKTLIFFFQLKIKSTHSRSPCFVVNSQSTKISLNFIFTLVPPKPNHREIIKIKLCNAKAIF